MFFLTIWVKIIVPQYAAKIGIILERDNKTDDNLHLLNSTRFV